MQPFKLELYLANFWEAEQLVQELTRFEGKLHSKGFGAWHRLRCEIRRVRRKLEKDAAVKPDREV
jgi:hypothetical protein